MLVVAACRLPLLQKVERHCPVRCMASEILSTSTGPDADVVQLPDGTFFNHRLGALNVFEIDVDESIIDEAASLFFDSSSECTGEFGSPFSSVTDMEHTYDELLTRAGRFFVQRVSGWRSNIVWVAVDDHASFSKFESIFKRLELPQRFASIIPHIASPRLYSAFFVVRSWCDAHNFHTDYNSLVGTHALTLITPLRDYTERSSFQLTYKAAAAGGEILPNGQIAMGTANADGMRRTPALKRYEYRRGKAIVFGSGFEHSTEPGAGHDGEVHAYLCFTFGTDDQERWPQIAETLDMQSRIMQQPCGELRLSALGRAIEAALVDARSEDPP